MAYLPASAVANLARSVGVPESQVPVAVAIARAESGFSTTAVGYNQPSPDCPRGSRDRGLWQINDCYHPNVSDAQAFDPVGNARAMYIISNGGTNWHPWATYNSGAYERYLGDVHQVILNNPPPPTPYHPIDVMRAAIRAGQNPIGAAIRTLESAWNVARQRAWNDHANDTTLTGRSY